MSEYPWGSGPNRFTANREQAIRNEVFTRTELEVMHAGGFDAVRADADHPLHDVYDDLDALEQQYEAIVRLVKAELTEERFFEERPIYGLRTTRDADPVIEGHRDAVEGFKPVLRKYDDPNYRYDAPDELDADATFKHTPEQALRWDVLYLVAGDILYSGGFPGVDRDPNHRRHNSPEGLARARREYDEVVTCVEPQLDESDYRYGRDCCTIG